MATATTSKAKAALGEWLKETGILAAEGKDYLIWPCATSLEVIGLTGDEGSGKTLWACSIDPRRTRVYSFEKGASNSQHLGIDIVDVRSEMLKLHPKGYTPVKMFHWLESELKSIEPGKYSVIAIDTIGDAEAGLADFVALRHRDFGYKSPDSFKSMGGVFWAAVGQHWKQLLADLATRCQTFVYTSHLRAVWKNGKPTPQREPQGKRVLRQLSSLCLWLYRDPNSEEPPTAEVHNNKMRLFVSDYVEGRLTHYPCLPPRMEKCDPNTIREYIFDPVGKRKLKKAEKIVVDDGAMTEDERLEMQRDIAADERAAEEAKLERMGVVKGALDATKQASQAMRETSQAIKEATPAVDPPPAPEPEDPPLSSEQLAEIASLKKQLQFGATAWKSLCSKYGDESARKLTTSQAEALIKKLQSQAAAESKEMPQPSGESQELSNWAEGALSSNK